MSIVALRTALFISLISSSALCANGKAAYAENMDKGSEIEALKKKIELLIDMVEQNREKDKQIELLIKQNREKDKKIDTLANRISLLESSVKAPVGTDHATAQEMDRAEKIRLQASGYEEPENNLLPPINKNPAPKDYIIRPHADGYVKLGNNRSLAGTELFYPITWNGEYMSFADMRFVADDNDGKEGNFGLGLRRIPEGEDYIYGIYGFYDRKRSSLGNMFSQATFGAEFLTENWDIRANGYLPLSDDKVIGSSNGDTSLSLSGTSIIAQSSLNTKTEKILSGFDAEIGYKIPWLSGTGFDDTRAYAGYFSFDGNNTKNIAGSRFRLRSRYKDWLQFGLEHQNDDVRGASNFAEIRLRYQFGKKPKQSQKPQGIYARLDEQVVRDIDIVTKEDTTITAAKTSKVINQSTGTDQVVYVVDNSSSSGGDGSIENPFNSLGAAQAVANANDIIYVSNGDGTNTGMNTGIVLNKTGQKLIGSGVALTYDSSTMQVSGLPVSPSDGTVIIPASSAPLISNSAGDAVTISANNVSIAGVQADSASGNGIKISNAQNVSIRNTLVTGNSGKGIFINSSGSSSASLLMEKTTITGNQGIGLELDDESTGSINADLGGGSLGSTGNNDISGNLGVEIAADLDGGNLSAQNNFWGGGTLTDKSGADSGNIDASAYKTSATCGNCLLSFIGRFSDQSNLQENKLITANNISASSFTGSRYVQVTGGGNPELVINGTPQGTSTGRIKSGDNVAIRLTSSTTGLATQATSIDTGAGTQNFNATTRFLPNAISGLQLWFDANDIDGDFDYTDNPGNGSAIALWKDKSGNNRDASQGTGSFQPTYNINGIGGANSMTFLTDYLSGNDIGIDTRNDDFTMIVVKDTSIATNYDTFISSESFGFATQVLRFKSGSHLFWTPTTGADIRTLTADNTANTVTSYRNGTLNTSGTLNPGPTQSVNFEIGRDGLSGIGGADYFIGDIGEVIIYNNDLSSSDRQAVEQYLGTKYGITVP